MSGVWTIFRRDLSRMIHSNVMGMLIVLFLVMMGALFFVDYFKDVRVLNLRPFFSQAPLLLSIFCPALTMGTIAGERRAQTLQWLETTPVGSFEIVAGKFLSCLALLSVVLCFTLSYPLTLSCLGVLDWGPVVGGYLALVMLGGMFISLGILASSLSRDQISSLLLAFFMCFVLTYLHRIALDSTGWWAEVLGTLSADVHFSNIARGVVDIRDILYAVTIQFFALSAAVLQLESGKYPVTRG
ncbi:MAG: ABC transporter permease [Bradymonadia bacterium]